MALSRPFSQLLHSIGSNTTLEQVHKKLAEIRAITKKSPVIAASADAKILEENLSDLSAQISSLTTQLISVAVVLERYESHMDLQLSSFISTIQAAIADYKSAYNATLIYDRVWFSKILLSQQAKSVLAEAIYQSVIEYNKDNIQTLFLIANHDPVLIDAISNPITDGTV